MEDKPIVVLDTNVVLDWLLFRDAGCTLLHDWLTRGQVRWLASEAMRDELTHVLARGDLDEWRPDTDALLAEWERWAVPASAGTPCALRCADPDDQQFIDFALEHGARWLLSRDRAVLQLARAAHAFGLAILTPRDWARSIGEG